MGGKEYANRCTKSEEEEEGVSVGKAVMPEVMRREKRRAEPHEGGYDRVDRGEAVKGEREGDQSGLSEGDRRAAPHCEEQDRE